MKLAKWIGMGMGAGLALRALMRQRRRIDFRDKNVLITGGSRGLGLAIARELASEGARLALVARDPEELEDARSEFAGARVLTIVGDLSDRETAEDVVSETVTELGGIDVLINNAGVMDVGPLEHMSADDFERALALHLWAPLSLMRAALPHLEAGSGRIVNISSIGGRVAIPHMAPYCASKFALVGLSDSFRAELGRRGVYVTTVCPGLMKTGSPVQARFHGDRDAEYAWFATGAAVPGITVSAATAARRIVRACRYGDPYLIVGWAARLLILTEAAFPGLAADAMSLVARNLPGPTEEESSESRKGWDSRGAALEFAEKRLTRDIAEHNQS